jgi:hypothetical protein
MQINREGDIREVVKALVL